MMRKRNLPEKPSAMGPGLAAAAAATAAAAGVENRTKLIIRTKEGCFTSTVCKDGIKQQN